MIGHRGSRLLEIGAAARHQIEALLGIPVYLDLRVKVLKGVATRPPTPEPVGLLASFLQYLDALSQYLAIPGRLWDMRSCHVRSCRSQLDLDGE